MIVEMPRIVLLPYVDEEGEPAVLECMASDYSTEWTVCSQEASICVVYHETRVYHKRMTAFFCAEHRKQAEEFVDDLLISITRQVKAECWEVTSSWYYRALSDDNEWFRLNETL